MMMRRAIALVAVALLLFPSRATAQFPAIIFCTANEILCNGQTANGQTGPVTLTLDPTIAVWGTFDTDGILVQTAADTFTARTLTGTTNQVNITNGDGVSGNPTFATPQDLDTGTDFQVGSLGLGVTPTTGQAHMITAASGSAFAGTGGTIVDTATKRIHTFTTSGTFTPNGSGNIEILVVAGGGGGGASVSGSAGGGGGGAGGVVYAATYAVTAQAYTVTVGTGGAAGDAGSGGVGYNGADSVFSTITAVGGGGGGGSPNNANSGGSGGGASNTTAGTGTQTASGGDVGYGTNGVNDNANQSGGGGGATQAGQIGAGNAGGDGGDGVAYSISGSSVTYAGGGGGHTSFGTPEVGGVGGSGGGGNGSNANSVVNPAGTGSKHGVDGLGGGGGGARTTAIGAGDGGDGIVIISYDLPTDVLAEQLRLGEDAGDY
ncbi:MAG: hypothetical protein VW405_05930, partial [Rhodospirillaceae bacterium]